MVINFNDFYPVFINGIKKYRRQDNEFKSNWKKVEPSDNSVMSLGLNKRSLLIMIKDKKANVCKTTPTNIQEDNKENFSIPNDKWTRI